jgi:hypothetical protein
VPGTCKGWYIIWNVFYDLFYCILISAFCQLKYRTSNSFKIGGGGGTKNKI